MAVPDFQRLMLPLLKLAGDGLPHTSAEAVEQLAQEFQLSEDDRTQLLRSGQPRLNNRVGWTTTYLKKAGLLQAVGQGRFQLTDRGRDVLASRPAAIDVAFLESRFPEMSEFTKARSRREVADEEPPAIFNAADGTWNQRAGVEERVRETLELSIPNEAIRREALRFLALAIENADEERGNAWYVRETEHGLRLMTGRLLACEIAPSKMRVSVIGPIGEDVRGVLGAEAEKDAEFKKIPEGLLLTFPIEHAAEALALLKDGFNSFVDAAMARVRRSVSLEDHVPEAVAYIGSIVDRELPQPEPAAETPDSAQVDDASDEDDVGASREPRVRGRAPIFEHGQRSRRPAGAVIRPEAAVRAVWAFGRRRECHYRKRRFRRNEGIRRLISMADALPNSVRYVKNGEGGKWWKAAKAHGQVHAGWRIVPHDLLRAADMTAIEPLIRSHFGAKRGATQDFNALCTLLDHPSRHLWVTFEDGCMWWCTVRDGIEANPDGDMSQRGHF